MPRFIDNIVDKQTERLIRNTLTTEHAELAIETALDKADELGNPLVGLLTPWLRENERWAAELINGFLLAYALGGEGFRTAEPEVRTLMRMRIHRQCVGELMGKEPGLSRREARERVRETITDEKIIEAANKCQAEHGVQGFEDIWTWLKENWWTILKTLLPLLLLFLGPSPVTEKSEHGT